MPVIEELVALYAGQAQAEKVQVGLEPFKITVGPGAQAIYSLIQAGAEDTQLASVGFAPVTFERQGTQVGFDVETLGVTHEFVACGLVHCVEPRTEGQRLSR